MNQPAARKYKQIAVQQMLQSNIIKDMSWFGNKPWFFAFGSRLKFCNTNF